MRKIVQIAVIPYRDKYAVYDSKPFALCDDVTLWSLRTYPSHNAWERLPDIQQKEDPHD